MATKSYIDIPQSETLSKILSPESADMYYPNRTDIQYQGALPIGMKHGNPLLSQETPCWSLAALFKVIPKHIQDINVLRIDISEKDFSIWYDDIGYGVNTELPDITRENPVDACYEMIIKLKEKGFEL